MLVLSSRDDSECSAPSQKQESRRSIDITSHPRAMVIISQRPLPLGRDVDPTVLAGGGKNREEAAMSESGEITMHDA